jgi:hypothetical protein
MQNSTLFKRCFEYIKTSQGVDGGIKSVGYTDILTEPRSTTFYTSLVLGALARAQVENKDVIRRAISFILGQRSKSWTWNYWKRESKEASHFPYPDDLDDTFVALSALSFHSPQHITSKAFAEITRTLIGQEKKIGGPYYTWIIPNRTQKQWKDIDIVVNSNIAHFLKQHNIALPALSRYLEECIASGSLTSAYYTSPVMVIYFVSLSYDGVYVPNLCNILKKLQQKDGSWGTPLLTACAASALARFGHYVEERVYTYLESSVDSLKPDPCFIERKEKDIIWNSGSTAWTAAVILEAFSIRNKPVVEKTKAVDMYEKTVSAVLKRLTTLSNIEDEALKSVLSKIVTSLITKDIRHEIALTPYFFWEDTSVLPRKIALDLCATNIFGWVAYTIFDNILDGDGNIEHLPVASLAIREVAVIFRSLLSDEHYKKVKGILNTIDAVNTWEYQNCRVPIHDGIMTFPKIIPTYGDRIKLAQKSLGHALGPIVLSLLGRKTKQSKLIESFFTHYLIARQMNDDAHDWWSDLEKGYLNSTSVLVLKRWAMENNHTECVLADEKEKLETIFWHNTIDTVSATIISYTNKAMEILPSLGLHSHFQFFADRLTALEQSARDAISSRDATVSFIHEYERE